MHDYWVYILASRRNGTLYIGMTSDLLRRVHMHREGLLPGFTKRYDVTRLVWFGSTPDVEAAIRREKRLKEWPRAWKINLIERDNPTWRDLYEEMVDGGEAGHSGSRAQGAG